MKHLQTGSARELALSLLIRGLIDRLIERELIGPSDILAIRDFTLDFTADIGGPIPAGRPDLYSNIKQEVLTLWESLGVPKGVSEHDHISRAH